MNSFFTFELLKWYRENQRDLPWRNTRDPYQIWLSEVILQQTRVQQGLPYFYKFIDRYPSVKELAEASEHEVLRLWEGLGYYSRARNLHSCATTIMSKHGGSFPDSYKGLMELKGIGRYTAAAIASFAFREVIPVVDGNVYRVLSRVFGVTTDISKPSAYKEFFFLAQQLIPAGEPDAFNQAIMEFGAMHCTPAKPSCENCPLNTICFAFQNNMQKALPIKKAKIKMKHRYFHYFVFISPDNKILMRKRKEGDIWQGLFDFYLIEAEKFHSPNTFYNLLLQQVTAKMSNHIWESYEIEHQLTHQRLHIKFFEFECDYTDIEYLKTIAPEFEEFTPEETKSLPKPVPIKNYLDKVKK